MSSLVGWGELYSFLKGVEILKARIDKNVIRELYLKGYNAKEIAVKLKCEVEAVRKCIQRNYENLKWKHGIAVKERKETIKAIDYEAKRCMTDKSFIIKNRSIYKTKMDGDIVINKEVAPVVSWDTPRRLTNENKNR